MPFFNFPHCKSIETLSCHSNQTKEPISIKTQTSIPQLKDAADEIWAQLAEWLQRRCRLQVLTDDDRRRQRSSPGTFGSGELKFVNVSHR